LSMTPDAFHCARPRLSHAADYRRGTRRRLLCGTCKRTAGRTDRMPYYRCPQCALTVHSAAGRFSTRICRRCSVPLEGTDLGYTPDRQPVTISRRFKAEPRAAAAARRALETLLWNLDPTQFQVAALLTTELVANSIEHASTCAP